MDEDSTYSANDQSPVENRDDRRREGAVLAFLDFSESIDRQLTELEERWASWAAPAAQRGPVQGRISTND